MDRALAPPAGAWRPRAVSDPEEPDDHVDRKHLRITGNHRAVAEPHVDIQDTAVTGDVIVVVTQAYGPRGDNLVGVSDVTFDGHPAVTLGLRAGGKEGLVHLSPIHGDSRKAGFTDVAPGTVCELFCPVSGELLPRVGDVEDESGAGYFAIYLTPALSDGSMVMVSDVWGHYHSRIIDDFELISAWAAREE
jgi:hypothetical protein